jgi:FKBP-type peptidyl-prolyl cis-trans isomerase FklB
MTNKLKYTGWLAIAVFTVSCSTAQKSSETVLENQMDSLSYAIGVSMGESINQQPLIAVNVEAVKSGLEKQIAGGNEWELADVDAFLRKTMTEIAEAEQLKAKADGEQFLVENGKKEGIITTASGLQYQVIQEGTGASPDFNDIVTVHYTGTLIDGTPFDSSVEKGVPMTRPANQLITGWTEGLQLMKEGSKMKFYIPSELGYGERPPGAVIPPHSVLVFDVELISVEAVD